MEISVIGINHRSTPVEIRERFVLGNDLAKKLLQTVRAEKIFSEALVLSTCNRTEIYFVNKTKKDSLNHLLNHIAKLKQTAPLTDTSIFYHHQGIDTVRHLFRVAGALDSQIVGEHQILGQLKNAYQLALEAGTARFLLNKLMHRAFRVGKKVQTQTQLGRGSVSIATSAVDLAGHVFSKLSGKTVLLVGAGETAELAAQALIRRRVSELIVANRSLNRAQQLAEDLIQNPRNAHKAVCSSKTCSLLAENVEGEASQPPLVTRAIDLNEIASVISRVDLLICSTDSIKPVLTYQNVADSLRHENHPLLIIDISVPRNVEARLGNLANVFLYNIDDLDMLVARNVEQRQAEIPRAEAIIDDELDQFAKWHDSLQVAPTVKLLQQHFEQLQQAQIVRYGRKFASFEQKELEEFSKGLCGKILHQPVSFLRDLSADSGNSEALAMIDTIRRMFDLDTLEQNK